MTIDRQPEEVAERVGEDVWCPLLDLDEGSYIVRVVYRAADTGNKLVFSREKGYYKEYDSILSDFAELPRGNPEGREWQTFETKVYLSRPAETFKIMVQYSGGWELTVKEISIRTDKDYPLTANKLFKLIVAFLLLDIIILLFIFRNSQWVQNRLNDKEGNTIFLGIIIITLLSSAPVFNDYLVFAHDLDFHLSRIENIKDGILSGVFPVRIGPDWCEGYGYAASVFYSDLLLYFPVALRLLGISLQNAYKSYVVVVNLGTAIIAYHSFKGFTGDKRLGLLLSGVYSLSVYRTIDIYMRCALGEFSAMMFLPLVAYGFYKIFFVDKDKWQFAGSVLILVVGLAGVVNTHVLSCVMTGIFVFIFCMVFIKKIFNRQRFVALASVVIITLLLSAWYLYPFLYYIMTGSFVIQTQPAVGIQQEGMFWSQFLTMNYSGSGTSLISCWGIKGEMPMGVGWGLILPFIVSIFLLVRREYTDKRRQKGAVFLVILSAFSMWMCTVNFPYDIILDICPLIGEALGKIEFPWRYLQMATLLLSVLAGVVLTELNFINRRVMYILAGALCLFTFLQSGMLNDNIAQGEKARAFRRYGISQVSNIASGSEYFPTGINVDTSNQELNASDDVQAAILDRNYNCFLLESINSGHGAGYVELPLIYYIGYRAEDETTGERLEVVPGEGMKVRVQIPKNYQGRIQVSYKEPVSWRIAEIVSIIMMIGMFFAGRIVYIHKKRFASTLA